MQRVIITTGGTGGHIFPALAVTEQLKQRYPAVQILFVGSQYGPEKELVAKAGIEFIGLPVRGVLGRGIKAVGAAVSIILATGRSLGIVGRFAPEVIVGFGGYGAFAPMMAGWLRGIPVILHEQNAIAGVSNRLLSRLARKVCVSLPETKGFCEDKCVLTGNPVRQDIIAVRGASKNFTGKRLLVVGGSQGARALTDAVLGALPRLREHGVQLCLQTGLRDAVRASEACVAAGYGPDVVRPFIDDMSKTYTWADLVLCRAGASTVAELAVAGLPAVLVPFPYATHDHQTHNAKILEKTGAAICIAEKDFIAQDGMGRVLQLLADAKSLRTMSLQTQLAAKPEAALAVVEQVEQCIK